MFSVLLLVPVPVPVLVPVPVPLPLPVLVPLLVPVLLLVPPVRVWVLVSVSLQPRWRCPSPWPQLPHRPKRPPAVTPLCRACQR